MHHRTDWLGDVAGVVMSAMGAEQPTNETTSNEKQTVEEENNLSSAIDLVAKRSLTFLTGTSYPDRPVKHDEDLLVDDLEEPDVISLAAESGCSAKKVDADSFEEYVYRLSCVAHDAFCLTHTTRSSLAVVTLVMGSLFPGT